MRSTPSSSLRAAVLAAVLATIATVLPAQALAAADSFQVNLRSELPANVSGARFAALAKSSGRQWGARYAGQTSRVPNPRDGVNVVAFSSGVDNETLAVTTVRSQLILRRSSRGKLRPWKRRVLDRDIAVNTNVVWQQGPAYPDLSQWDLETTLIHEFGHFYGIGGHFSDCANSALSVSLYNGEWWRARNDWYRHACPNSRPLGTPDVPGPGEGLTPVAAPAPETTSATGPQPLRRGRFVEREIVTRRVVG